jgi:hypothetical protein
MMATTHALAGLLLGAGVAAVAPEFATLAMVAGFAGGLFPDLDLYVAHRKTLHFPVYFPAAAGLAAGVAALVPTAATVGAAVFLAGAALHAASDLLGGGLELRPWEGESDRAVYSHYHGRWLAPRRLVPYDGAPADLALAGLLGLPALAVGAGTVVDPLVTAALVVSVAYTLVRKRLADLADTLAGFVPRQAASFVPERYL